MPREKTLREKAARVAAMSWDELRTRLRQEVAKRSDALFPASMAGELRSANGRPKRRSAESSSGPQPSSPSGRFFFDPQEIGSITSILRQRLPHQSEEIIQQAARICDHHFDLLGFQGLNFGKTIDWRYEPLSRKRAPVKPWYKIHCLQFSEVGDHKLVWELNRHQHLVTLAKAFHLSGEERFLTELVHQWRHWQQENPYPAGMNWASSLEVAFRSLAWLWVGRLLASVPAAPKSFQYELFRALAVSARHIERYLSTYSSPNTHLLGEAVALFFIGTLCPRLRSSRRWQTLGWAIILEQAEKQVRTDGMHFEQSTYYHIYALDFFLHARILADRNAMAIPEAFERTIEKMLEMLMGLSQAGVAPRFGDDDGGRVFDPHRNQGEHLLDPLSTGALLYRRGDFKAACDGLKEETLWLLGPGSAQQFDALEAASAVPVSRAFPASGLYVMASAAEEPEASGSTNLCSRQLVIDAGPQGTDNCGHGHADALSVHLSAGGEEWLTDPGAFRYITEGSERDAFRGTDAHNTLEVDRVSQADPVAPFVWRETPEVARELWISTERLDLFMGSHNGYQRLREPVLHRRWVFFLKPLFWLVRDVVEGVGEHYLRIFWHFAPNVSPSYTAPGFTMLSSPDNPGNMRGLVILPVERNGWSQELCRGQFSPAYGVEQPAPMIRFGTRTMAPADFAVILQPLTYTNRRLGSFVSLNGFQPGAPRGYRYETSGARHRFIFSDAVRNEAWDLGGWKSDARFVYAGRYAGGKALHLALCAGSFLEVNGQRIIACDRAVECCELIRRGSEQQICCSDPNAATECKIEDIEFQIEV